jgi:hypothetical protein
MARSWFPLLLCLGFASPAAAAPGPPCPYLPESRSYTEATAGPPVNSGSQSGHPAVSSASAGHTGTGYNMSANSGMAIDNGYFSYHGHTGGDVAIKPFGSDGAGAYSEGSVTDCLTFGGGYAGAARAHLPIALDGSAFISWSIGGAYVPPSTVDPAFARLTIACAAYAYGSMTLSSCDDPDFVIDASGGFDETVELVFQFTFGDPITIQYSPRGTTGVGYAANGSDGFLQGTATFGITGVVQPMYVTDFGGNVLPDATVSATSGYDYFQPVPEPRGVALAAIAVLVAKRALRRS